ncbi:MAG: hypothetical protein JRC92_03560 [Deltaproteobacteria bacterium]|nr:hypothetical protein [Deltaproteobacteria bacterium]
MERRGRLLIMILVAAALLVAPVTCLAQPKYGGTLVIGLSQDLEYLDFHKTASSIPASIGQLVTNCLIEPDRFNNMKPALAESWDILEDGRVYVFHLRKGVKFHNGREFTADDVVFNIKRIQDPKTGASMASMFADVVSVEAIDKYTVRFNLKDRSGTHPASHGGTQYRAPMLAKECINEDGSITHPIGTGPFEFVEWNVHDYLKFKKFDDYWEEGLPYVDEIICPIVPDQTIRLVALKVGDIDWASFLPPDVIAPIIDNPPKGVVYSLEGPGYLAGFHFNTSRPPLDDARVRRAIAHCIIREEHVIPWSYGYGLIINQPFMPSSFWYCDVPTLERDIDKAKALLAEAGYPDGIDITITYGKEYEEIKGCSELLEQQVKPAGIRLRMEPMAWTAYVAKVSAQEYDLFCTGWNPVADPSLIYNPWYLPDGSYNKFIGDYSNPKVTELLLAAAAEPDNDKRKALYTEALTIVLTQDVPNIWLSSGVIAQGWRTYVKGYVQPLHDSFVWSEGGFKRTWLDK